MLVIGKVQLKLKSRRTKMSNKEKSIRRALNAIQKHIASFDYDSVDRYTKLVGFLLNESNLPDDIKKKLVKYCGDTLNPDNGIFESCSDPDVAEYIGEDSQGNKLFNIIPGQEDKFISRIESSASSIIESFEILKEKIMCA